MYVFVPSEKKVSIPDEHGQSLDEADVSVDAKGRMRILEREKLSVLVFDVVCLGIVGPCSGRGRHGTSIRGHRG